MDRVDQRQYDVDKPFVLFWGGIYSNWCKCNIEFEGTPYNTTEQIMMAEKAKLFQDWEVRKEILRSKKPKEQKALGRKVKGFTEAVWQANMFDIVYKANLAKFSQNADMKAALLATEDRLLAEASPLDKIWGIGLREEAGLEIGGKDAPKIDVQEEKWPALGVGAGTGVDAEKKKKKKKKWGSKKD